MKYLFNFLCFFLLINTVLSQDNYYWVGGSGSWSDLNHWQLENGTNPSSLPHEINPVIFNENSFVSENDYVHIDVLNALCNDMVWENIPFNAWLTGGDTSILHIYGSLIFHENVINEFFGKFMFDGLIGDTGKTIELNGITFRNSIFFIGLEGEWNLMDDLWMNNAALIENTGQIYFEHGSLNTNGHDIFCSSVHSNFLNTRSLNIQNSSIHLYAQGEIESWSVNLENMNLQAEGSEVIIHEDQARFVSINGINHGYGSLFLKGVANKIENSGELFFQKIQVEEDFCDLGSNITADSVIINGNECSMGSGADINNLIVTAQQFSLPEGLYIKRLISEEYITISGSNYIEYGKFTGHANFLGNNTFDTLILRPTYTTSILGSHFYFQSGATQEVMDSLYIRGNYCSTITLAKTTGSDFAYLKKDFGDFNVSCDYLFINGVAALSETIDFYAGTSSTSLNPSDPPPGWIFENAPNYLYGFGGGTSEEACWGDTIILDATCFNGDEETKYYWNSDTVPGEITYAVWEPQTVHILVAYAEGCYVADYATIEFDSCENSIYNNFMDKLVKIYPNPTKGILNLEFTQIVNEFKITLCNSMGVVLFSETFSPASETNIKTYDFANQETGVYYVRMEFKGRVYVRQVIIY